MMTDDTDNLRLLALAATSRPMVAPGVSYAEGAALLRLLDRVDAAEAERDNFAALLRDARAYVEQDVVMMADLTRHSPLDADGQHRHDTTEYASEKLLPRIDAALGEDAK